MKRSSRSLFTALFVLVAISACSKNNEDNAEEPKLGALSAQQSVLDTVHAEEQVLATVGGTRIGEDDLTVNMARTLGDAYSELYQSEIQETLLQSMIASRAIALQALSVLDEDERIALEKRVAQFREELLVKQYLLDNAEASEVSNEQITTYYEENPQEFAGKQERLYELVTVSQADYRRDMSGALQTVSEAKTHDDWQALSRASTGNDNGITLTHSLRTLTGNESQGAIETAVRGLNEGQLSKVILADGAPYLVRLLTVTRQESIPLEQARADIRRKLLPVALRQSVRSIADQVLENTTVVTTASTDQ